MAINQEYIVEMVKDKVLFVAGNGLPYTDTEADVVVRMNYGIQDPCDIWVDGAARFNPYTYPLPPVIMRLHRHHQAQHRQLYTIPEQTHYNMIQDLGGIYPTTGMRALWWFKTYTQPSDFIISGFGGDFNRYSDAENWQMHQWDKEREILRRWEDEKILRRI